MALLLTILLDGTVNLLAVYLQWCAGGLFDRMTTSRMRCAQLRPGVSMETLLFMDLRKTFPLHSTDCTFSRAFLPFCSGIWGVFVFTRPLFFSHFFWHWQGSCHLSLKDTVKMYYNDDASFNPSAHVWRHCWLRMSSYTTFIQDVVFRRNLL